MAILTAAQAAKQIDKLAACYNAVLGTSASGFGIGDGTFGASLKASDLKLMVNGSTDATFSDTNLQILLDSAANDLATSKTLLATVINLMLSTYFGALSTAAAAASSISASILDIDTFMTYYNAANAWACLAPPEWLPLFKACRGAAPTPQNVYLPVTQGATYAQGMGSFNAATTTFTAAPATGLLIAGGAVDLTKYAGGFPWIQWTGGAGSGAATITVNGLDNLGVARTFTLSGTWGAGAFTAANSGVALVPSLAGALVSRVTGISMTGITAGVFYVESRPPAGRVWPTS